MTIPKPYLISCPTGEASFNDQYMVYLESSYDEERNAELMQHFRLLVTITRLCGFNFIYIPKMVEEFRGMKEQLRSRTKNCGGRNLVICILHYR